MTFTYKICYLDKTEGAEKIESWCRDYQSCTESQKQAPVPHENRYGGACLKFLLGEGRARASGRVPGYPELYVEVRSKLGLQ